MSTVTTLVKHYISTATHGLSMRTVTDDMVNVFAAATDGLFMSTVTTLTMHDISAATHGLSMSTVTDDMVDVCSVATHGLLFF
jgi:hypothetical protein